MVGTVSKEFDEVRKAAAREVDLRSLLEDKPQIPTRNLLRDLAKHEPVPRYLTDPCLRDTMIRLTDKNNLKPFERPRYSDRPIVGLGKVNKEAVKDADDPRRPAAWIPMAYIATLGTPIFFVVLLLCKDRTSGKPS